MYLTKEHVLIVLALELVCCGVDGEKTCSCYTFENGSTGKMTWRNAKRSCEYNKKHLVVMETEREWEFINNEIKRRNTTDNLNEWLIGLFLNKTTGNWAWINGKPMTINKWRDGKPLTSDFYALVHKEWPYNSGTYGVFNSIKGNVERAWICEQETDNCQGVCFHHKPVTTTTTLIRSTTTTTTERKTETSTAQYKTDKTDSTDSTGTDGQKGDKSDSTTVIVAVPLAAVLFIALIALAVVCFLRRRKRRPQDAERLTKKSPSKQPENPYESIDSAEAAKLLGKPNSDIVRPESKQASPNIGCEYAMVNKDIRKQKKGDPVSETKQAPPKMDHEYAVVNKENKRQKKGDLIYAQLDVAEFDDVENDTKVQKPAQYEPTVYADVVSTDVFHRADPDSTQPTYANA